MSDAANTYTHLNRGTCSMQVSFTLDEDDRVHDVAFERGCNGNLSGIAKLIEGMDAETVIDRCLGTPCGQRPTSCPDQLARALQEALAERHGSDSVDGGTAPSSGAATA